MDGPPFLPRLLDRAGTPAVPRLGQRLLCSGASDVSSPSWQSPFQRERGSSWPPAHRATVCSALLQFTKDKLLTASLRLILLLVKGNETKHRKRGGPSREKGSGPHLGVPLMKEAQRGWHSSVSG